MTKDHNSSQEEFWAGDFGHEYIERNRSDALLASNIHLFTKIFSSIEDEPKTFLELGANIGMNIVALKELYPNSKFTAIEINKVASEELKKTGSIVINSSILEAEVNLTHDLVFSKGVLIHLDPKQLKDVYNNMYKWSKKYILIAEYYNPIPVGIPYRGHEDKLFKRDFAGELMDMFPHLKLRDYGFAYHRDSFPQDDINWFLLEKVENE